MSDLTRREFIAASAAMAALPGFAQDEGFVVHEWGVVTVANGTDIAAGRTHGTAVFNGVERDPGLPAFVTTWHAAIDAQIEQWKNQPMIVKKPVLHFYAKKRTTVTVRVSIPTGRPDAWWPPAAAFAPKLKLGSRFTKDGSTPDVPPIESVVPRDGLLHWSALILDPEATEFRDAEGWWAVARKVPSTPVRFAKEAEKFVFYDCLAEFTPRTRIDWTKEGVTIRNDSPEDIPLAIALRVSEGVCSHASSTIAKGAKASLAPVKGEPDLAGALVGAGLTKPESDAIVEIWRDEFFKADGVRVLLLLGREAYDRLLPIDITPRPADLKRVLIAHVECLDEARIATIKAWIEQLGAGEIEARDRAVAHLRPLGPLAHPLLREAHDKTTDAEVKARIAELLPKK